MSDDSISFEQVAAMMRGLPKQKRNMHDPFSLPMLARPGFGVPVYVNQHHPKRIARYETKRFAGHPFIRWLARALPSWAKFEPDILIEVPVYEDEPFVMRTPMGLFVSPSQYAMIKDIGA